MAFPKRSVLALVAALVGVFSATQVSALPNTDNSTTPDLTLIVWDTTKSVTYFRDLDFTWTAGTVGTVFGSSLTPFTADSNWSNFLTALGGSLTDTTFYDVVSGTTAAGARILVTTGGAQLDGSTYTGPPNTTLTPVNGTQLQSAIGQWSTLATNNANTSSPPPVFPNFQTASGAGVTPNVHGSNISVSGDPGEASSAPAWDNGFGQNTFTTFANVGAAMNFFSMSGGTALAKATVTSLPGQWLLSANGNLTYTVTAVPEPANWALLLSGLGIVSLVARRRLKTL